jgi:hypothetical protein
MTLRSMHRLSTGPSCGTWPAEYSLRTPVCCGRTRKVYELSVVLSNRPSDEMPRTMASSVGVE